MRVIAHMIVWNSYRYLPELFASLDAQEYKDFTIRVLDNGSTDESYAYLHAHYPHTVVVRNVRNLGFAPGHNQLIRFTLEHLRSEELENTAILIMNPDMILDAGMVKELVAALESDASIDAVQPKLYRAFAEHAGDEVLEETVKSDILDTTGMRVTKGWRMVDRGAGEIDRGQYDGKRDLFAPTGTCSLYRASALRDVLVNGEFYDGEFNTYREDCDLAWRWRWSGHRSSFVPSAKAWHYRGMAGAERLTLWQRLVNRRGQRPFLAALSTRNQLFVLLKNLTLADLFRSLPWLMFHEGGRVAYGFFFEPETRKMLMAAPRLVPSMLRKRAIAKALWQEEAKKMRTYIGM